MDDQNCHKHEVFFVFVYAYSQQWVGHFIHNVMCTSTGYLGSTCRGLVNTQVLAFQDGKFEMSDQHSQCHHMSLGLSCDRNTIQQTHHCNTKHFVPTYLLVEIRTPSFRLKRHRVASRDTERVCADDIGPERRLQTNGPRQACM